MPSGAAADTCTNVESPVPKPTGKARRPCTSSVVQQRPVTETREQTIQTQLEALGFPRSNVQSRSRRMQQLELFESMRREAIAQEATIQLNHLRRLSGNPSDAPVTDGKIPVCHRGAE